MIKTRRTRPGFNWMRLEWPDLYTDWRKFCRRFIDQYDWGFLNPGRANSKNSLNCWLAGDTTISPTPRHPFALSLATMQDSTEDATEDHNQTIYVCSHPHSHRGFVLVDIDDKTGEHGDAQDVFEYVNDLLIKSNVIQHRMFNQPSTGGHGWHGYAFLHYPNHTARQIRDIYDRLGDHLAADVAKHGFGSSIEIKAQPSIVTAGHRYQTCGQLAKFPRLGRDIEQYRKWLYQTPQIDIDRLVAMVNGSDVITNSLRREERRRERVQKPAHRPTNGSDPAKRMGDLAKAYSQQLGRPATADELLAEYEQQGLNTGHDHDSNRAKLAKANAAHVAKTWDPTKATSGRRFDPADYLPLIRKHVTQEIRSGAKSRVIYDDQDLAIMIYTVETNRRPNHRRRYGCPNNSFIEMARTLGRDWGKPNTARMRIAAMKRALTAAKLIRCIDPTYRFGNDGQGKKYDIGTKHPEYREE